MRAWDFRDDWADLLQEVLTAVVVTAREGGFEDTSRLPAFVRRVTHNKFQDRLRLFYGRREGDTHSWEAATEPGAEDSLPAARIDLDRALAKLPPRRRQAVLDVYAAGLTYPEAAAIRGVPLGTLKRDLRDGLRALREALAEEPDLPPGPRPSARVDPLFTCRPVPEEPLAEESPHARTPAPASQPRLPPAPALRHPARLAHGRPRARLALVLRGEGPRRLA